YMSQFLYENFETIFLLTNRNHSFISSSAIKELIYFNGSIEGLVPENVRKYIIDNHIGRVQDENN
ncbi:MAG: pantetheine-phosphate adenylyltransferase, partial [Firmicutes bacterium]|nr:pantetheine-phosphate adenylyltransferase [Bacillota bacterium]